jgi:sugar O-acyltransferase (sialic acid O-acetyltransferase NeuD family)
LSSIVVFGTGGMGREAGAWIVDAGMSDDLAGFLDANPTRRGTEVAGRSVLGGFDWLDAHPEAQVVLAVGSPARRAAIIAELDRRRRSLATIVHPSAVIGPSVTIGTGSIVCPSVVLTCDIALGRAVIVDSGALIGHDGRIDDVAFFVPRAHLADNVTVREWADIGIGASVIQGITIGAGAVVGARAVMIRDVEPDTTVVGVPARPLPDRRR